MTSIKKIAVILIKLIFVFNKINLIILGDPSNDDVLYIAVAGSHQIWAYNFVTKR